MSKTRKHRRPPFSGRLISVAMIAKNEAANLVRAVESAQRFADEIILVDTGSTDDTVKVARGLGVQVFERPWRHDFSDARNFSFSKCRGRYVFWQDPDEEVPEEDAAKIRAYAQGDMFDDEVDEFVFATYLNGSYRPPEQDLPGYGPGVIVLKPRMVRRGDFSWQWPVHENLFNPGSVVRHEDGNIRVFNHGNATDATVEYYHALMVIAARDAPEVPHFQLYLAEWDMIHDRDPGKALGRLGPIDPEQLGSGEQVEKYWLFIGRAQKMIALTCAQNGMEDETRRAANRAVSAYSECQSSRGPLEMSTLFLLLGVRETFDKVVAALLEQHPGELMAQYFQRFSQEEPDDRRLCEQVMKWLDALNQGEVDMATAYGMAKSGVNTPLEADDSVEEWDPETETRKIVVVVPYRLPEDQPERKRNLEACLRALAAQDVDCWDLRLVEQDADPGTISVPGEKHPEFLFDRSYEPFNRGRALNFGVAHSGAKSDDLVCLMDADVLVDPGWLRRCMQHITTYKARMCLPYSKAIYMDERTTVAAIAEGGVKGPEEQFLVSGETFHSQGGCIWMTAELYEAMGGHDERYVGWGSADRDFYHRGVIALGTDPLRIPQALYHMHHSKPDESRAEDNSKLFAETHPDVTEAEAAKR